MPWSRWLPMLALAGGCLPFGGGMGRVASATMARSDSRTMFGAGDLVGIVIDSATGAPIPNVVLFATTDTSVSAPITPWRTHSDSTGWFQLSDVPAGWRVLEARGIGYARQRRTVLVRRGAADTVWISLRSGTALLAQQREELARPTGITPCRPADVTAAWLTTAIAEAVAADPGLPRKVKADDVRLVVKPGACRKAIGAVQEQAGKSLHEPQVYLFELGDVGYAVYDPVEALGNTAVVVPVLDRGLRLLKVLAL